MAIHCFTSLTACMCFHINTVGTEAELVLRNHVMPHSHPHGHAALCLSAFPTTPIMHLPPAVNTKDSMETVYCRMGCWIKRKKGWNGGGPSKCYLSRL